MIKACTFVFLALTLLTIQAIPASIQRLLQVDPCPNMTKDYKIYLIESNVQDSLKDCTYSYTLSVGDCSYTSPAYKISGSNRVCYDLSGSTCKILGDSIFRGSASRFCNGNLTVEPLGAVTNFPLNQEFSVNNSFSNVRVMVGVYCNGQTVASPRKCTSFATKTNLCITVLFLVSVLLLLI